MKPKNRRTLTALVLVVIAIGLAVWVGSGARDGDGISAPRTGHAVQHVEHGASSERATDPAISAIDDETRRAAIAAEIETVSVTEPAEPPPGRYETRIVARIVDAFGVPCVGARMSILLAIKGNDQVPTIAIADASGVIDALVRWETRSTLPEGFQGMTAAEMRAVLDVTHADHFPARRLIALRGGRTTDAGTIRLDGVGRLVGTVRSTLDIDGTEIEVHVRRDPAVELRGARTSTFMDSDLGETIAVARLGRDGEFAFDSVPATRLCVIVSRPGSLFVSSPSIDVRAGDVVDVGELLLTANSSIVSGVVVMPDGRPCAHAQIAYGRAGDSNLLGENVDANGRFHIEDVEFESLKLVVSRRHDATFCETVFEPIAAGSRDLVLRIDDCPFLDVHVKDEAGHAIESFRIAAWFDGEREPRGGSPVENPGGIARVASSSRSFRVHVESPGYEKGIAGPYSDGRGGTVRIVLRRARTIEGRVVAEGKGMPGVPVFLHTVSAAGATFAGDLPAHAEPYPRANTTTDASGRFAFELPAADRFLVIARARDHASRESPIVDVRGDATLVPLMLELDRGGSVVGIVTSKSGRDLGGTMLAVSCGDGYVVKASVGTDGAYRIDRLAAGTWWIGPRKSNKPSNYDDTSWRYLSPPVEFVVVRDRERRVDLEVD